MTAPDIAADAVIAVTFFSDYAAATKREEALHLSELADRIATTTAASKAALPWLKGAKFGDAKTPLVLKPDGKRTGGSLRHNENVLAISAVEGDYDREQMSVMDAAERLRTAGVRSLVYTSPSHTEDAPRWRVLCPLSQEYPPDRRNAFMARLNGLFGGIFSGESWTLSQSYYYGSVNRSPSHHVQLIAGTPIDQMDELDAGAIGKPAKAGNGNGAERPLSSGAACVSGSCAMTSALSSAASRCWCASTSTQLQSAYGKWPGLFARIALTFHLIEIADAHATGMASPYPLVISEQTARRAAAFMLEIALPHLLRAHRLMFSTAQTGHAQWIAGYILAERSERITSRDVVRAYGSLRAPEAKDELAAVMASLVTIGWLEPEVPTNAAKPVSTWAVNPAVHVRFADLAEREQARREKARAELAAYFAALKTKQAEINAP